MAKKVSLHIAVGKTGHDYPERFGDLPGAPVDAAALATLAQHEGLDVAEPLLIDEKATAGAVRATLSSYAKGLAPGDLLLVTFSGHGSRAADKSGDEFDPHDETLVLYDRQLLDDELWEQWALFKAGVRIVAVFDSCYSGTAARRDSAQLDELAGGSGELLAPRAGLRARRMPPAAREADMRERAAMYELAVPAPVSGSVEVGATVLLYAACQDRELANEGDAGGVFTRAFIDTVKSGVASYDELAVEVKRRTKGQTPDFKTYGAEDLSFTSSRPFS